MTRGAHVRDTQITLSRENSRDFVSGPRVDESENMSNQLRGNEEVSNERKYWKGRTLWCQVKT